MKIKRIIFTIAFVMTILLGTNISKAAGIDLSASSTSVNVGDNVTITASFTAAAWNLDVTGNGIEGAQYAAQTSDLSEKTTTNTFKLDTSKAGTYTIRMYGDITNENGDTIKVDKSVTVTVKAVDNGGSNNNNNNNNGGSTGGTTVSSEARLKNLGINPNDFKGFRRNTTSYDVEVPNNVSKVNVYASPVDDNAKVTGTGNVTLKEGVNTVKVTVTAQDGKTQKTYTLNITRKIADAAKPNEDNNTVSSEARLKNLGIKPKEYDFTGFKRDTTTYDLEVPNTLTEIEIYAEPVNSKATIKGTGKVSLKDGKNQIQVEVTAEDKKTKKTYTLNITKATATEKEPETNENQTNTNTNTKLGLTSFMVKGETLTPKFDSETYEYKMKLTTDINSIEIEAKANNSNAKIEIIGNHDLQDGENTITILVSNVDTDEVVTYQIIVNKEIEKDNTAVAKVDWLKPETWTMKEKIIAGVAILLVIIIIVLIIIKIKLARSEDDDELDLPGADELDKAIAEHQELQEEQNQEEEQEPKTDIERAQEYFESYSRNNKRRGKHF